MIPLIAPIGCCALTSDDEVMVGHLLFVVTGPSCILLVAPSVVIERGWWLDITMFVCDMRRVESHLTGSCQNDEFICICYVTHRNHFFWIENDVNCIVCILNAISAVSICSNKCYSPPTMPVRAAKDWFELDFTASNSPETTDADVAKDSENLILLATTCVEARKYGTKLPLFVITFMMF